MKTFILIALFAGIFIYPVFSQPNYQFKWDSTIGSRFCDTTKRYFNLALPDKIYGLPYHSLDHKNQSLLKEMDEYLHFRQGVIDSNECTHIYDHMPVIVPEGNYTMIIVKPDPAVKYYLLIKKP